jgi:hypothetical protein
MRGIDKAGLDEGALVVKFHAVDMKRRLGNAKATNRGAIEHALVSEIVNRENRRELGIKPPEIARDECTLPVIGVNKIRRSFCMRAPDRNLCCGIGERSEANVVVGPIAAVLIAVGIAAAFEKGGANNDVIGLAVAGVPKSDL